MIYVLQEQALNLNCNFLNCNVGKQKEVCRLWNREKGHTVKEPVTALGSILNTSQYSW